MVRYRTFQLRSDESRANLTSFIGRTKLQKVTLNMVARFVDDKQVKDLHDMFKSMDTHQNGVITMFELREGLKKSGLEDLAKA